MAVAHLEPGDAVVVYGQRFVLNSIVVNAGKPSRVTFEHEGDFEELFPTEEK